MKRRTPIGNIVGGPSGPKGASNWPCGDAASITRGGAPTRERPDSPWVMSTTSQRPAVIAAAAWRTWSRNEQPPTAVVST